jgi:hypothetical protein
VWRVTVEIYCSGKTRPVLIGLDKMLCGVNNKSVSSLTGGGGGGGIARYRINGVNVAHDCKYADGVQIAFFFGVK